ncbi:MAG TPA: c-type cytochrome [Candidatus Polarisedimenticolaceae bacterium]|nr:c-type cytochrome [Candidatus Polarisedimenticolaceae bacterium]
MRANKHLLLWTSLGTLLALSWAAYAEHGLQQWRSLQQDYRDALPPAQAELFRVQLRQVHVPVLGATDRCVSCHVGMSPAETGIRGVARFAAHPDVVHDPSRFGCTVCHGGQGLATVAEDAHGGVRHWPEPMIPQRHVWAGCGTCHAHLQVTNIAEMRAGRDLFERYDCLACHKLEGRGGLARPGAAGGMEGPDLSRAGATGYDAEWYEGHLARRERETSVAWRSSFGPMPAVERASIDTFLASRVGAPGLVEAKALFHSLGCRGCHPVHGVGGDDGPDLTSVGQKDPGQLDFTHVPGERTLSNWLAEHFRAPAKIVPDSKMPYLGLTEQQIDALVFYMLSLRTTEFPEGFWPEDRVRVDHFGEREFAGDGATLYGTFCASCHGPQGQGMRYPGMTAFPAIANPDFLRLASDDFLRATLTRGRPGRRMPAWGEKTGGLRPDEIETLVRFLRELGGVGQPETDGRPDRWAAGDPARGMTLWRENCASCHGTDGEGAEGPAIANRVLLDSASDSYFAETIRRGRRGTTMPAFSLPSPVRRTLDDDEIEALVAYIRDFEDGTR